MVIVWCHNWEDASKFQYLMQILQIHWVPRYQIFMFDDSKIYGSIQQWQEPTTVWDRERKRKQPYNSWLLTYPKKGLEKMRILGIWAKIATFSDSFPAEASEDLGGDSPLFHA